jgi:hypothetical protein
MNSCRASGLRAIRPWLSRAQLVVCANGASSLAGLRHELLPGLRAAGDPAVAVAGAKSSVTVGCSVSVQREFLDSIKETARLTR